ncbi:MAG: DNA-processing protein DprA [Enhygromyxa sp.]
MKPVATRELAYWLALAFHLPRARVRDKNLLVLQAAHEAKLSLLELVACETEALPESLRPWAAIHAGLLEAEGRVSAQAFLVDRLARAGIGLLPITDENYPAHLLERLTPDKAPTLLSLAGDVALLREPGIAISGSRKAGPAGLHFARALGRALAEQGFVLISGLARGVDTEAMDGALEAGGRVIGVSPEGIFAARAVRRRELQEGRLTVISEFEPTARWAGWAAMRRNSTIAGLSHALVIADCVARGGTTAQFDVHRDLGLPVYIRRGRGEGRLMAELAAQPGAFALPWTGGPVELPAALRRGGAPRGLSCSVWRDGGRVLVNLDAPDSWTVPEIIDALRAELRVASVREEPPVYELAKLREGSVACESPPTLRESTSQAAKDDPVLRALADMDDQRGTLAELCERVGWSAKKTRMKLRALQEAGKIAVDRSGRAHVFALLDSDPKPSREPAPRCQLELLSG